MWGNRVAVCKHLRPAAFGVQSYVFTPPQLVPRRILRAHAHTHTPQATVAAYGSLWQSRGASISTNQRER